MKKALLLVLLTLVVSTGARTWTAWSSKSNVTKTEILSLPNVMRNFIGICILRPGVKQTAEKK